MSLYKALRCLALKQQGAFHYSIAVAAGGRRSLSSLSRSPRCFIVRPCVVSPGQAAFPRPPIALFKRGMFITTEETPNPDSMKFLPGQSVLPGETRNYTHAMQAHSSPLAKTLLSEIGIANYSQMKPCCWGCPHRCYLLFLTSPTRDVDGVTGVFLGEDFITVSKDPDTEWMDIKTDIFGVIMEHFSRYFRNSLGVLLYFFCCCC